MTETVSPRTRTPRRRLWIASGVIVVVLLVAAAVATGRAWPQWTGGEVVADEAETLVLDVDGVVEGFVSSARPGLPINVQYSSQIILAEGLTPAEQARVVDEVLVIARDVLGGTVNYNFFFSAARYEEGELVGVDFAELQPMLGDFGMGEDGTAYVTLGSATIMPDALRAYVSPYGEE